MKNAYRNDKRKSENKKTVKTQFLQYFSRARKINVRKVESPRTSEMIQSHIVSPRVLLDFQRAVIVEKFLHRIPANLGFHFVFREFLNRKEEENTDSNYRTQMSRELPTG